jgi:hypothetical protein
MIDDYFENIDTKSKAYWLGFLYADGCVFIYKGFKRLEIAVKIDDDWIIDSFIQAIQPITKKFLKLQHMLSAIRINSQKICDDLISHGCVPRKSKIIELPVLDSRELYLAFLLGFFDGDGTQNKTMITCGSLKFLEQIKEKFSLMFKIHHYEKDTIAGKRACCYALSLGTSVFNEMMDNYADSLPRKRKHFCTKEERGQRAAEASRNNDGKPKMTITKDELERLVWEIPATHIAKKLGVSDRLITKRCQQLGIEKPSRGFWSTYYHEHKV